MNICLMVLIGLLGLCVGAIIGLGIDFKINHTYILEMIDLEKNYSIEELISLNSNLLQLLKTNERKNADLSLINLSKNSGTLLISKKLKPGMKFISESITGYYKKVLYEVN